MKKKHKKYKLRTAANRSWWDTGLLKYAIKSKSYKNTVLVRETACIALTFPNKNYKLWEKFCFKSLGSRQKKIETIKKTTH